MSRFEDMKAELARLHAPMAEHYRDLLLEQGEPWSRASLMGWDIADDVMNAYLSRDGRFILYPWLEWKYVLPRFLGWRGI